MTDAELPGFLYGTFDWRINGLHFASLPPIDLLTHEALNSSNPWIVLASIVEHAKKGDHSHVALLEQFFFLNEPFALNRISLALVGDLGSTKDLSLLEFAMRSDDAEARKYAATAAQLAGALSLHDPCLATC